MVVATRREQSSPGKQLWALVARQHGVVARAQLLDFGLGVAAIRHRLEAGRLHEVARGIYAVGRPELDQLGRWMAAVLSCGPGAVVSHESAAALWGIRHGERRGIEVSTTSARRRRPGLVVHRRRGLTRADVTEHRGIPVTTPACTIVDLATRLPRDDLEALINTADKLDLIGPETLRAVLRRVGRRPGAGATRRVLHAREFTMTDSELERRLLPIAGRAGLDPPETGRWVNGFRVDFFWPRLGLVVETDGLRYHRTPAQQARDRLRDQAHTASGLVPLRFTRAQVRFEPEHVEATLRAVRVRLTERLLP